MINISPAAELYRCDFGSYKNNSFTFKMVIYLLFRSYALNNIHVSISLIIDGFIEGMDTLMKS